MKPECFEAIANLGILPVISLGDEEAGGPLADALAEGGIPAVEITLRSPGALAVIRRIRAHRPEMTILAGTVLAPEQADAAVEAGADGVVTPGFSAALVGHCRKQQIPVVPGCVTAAEIQSGMDYGLSVFKFFPAESCGGLEALTLFHGPFPGCSFIPTGGMTPDNIGSYLAKPFIAACGGSFMAPAADIAAGRWDAIRDSCRRCMDISLGIELAHVGINHENAESALAAAQRIGELFRLPVRPGNSSVFAGSAVEHMKSPFHGTHGHIGFSTRSVARALAWYRASGVAVREESIRRDAKGEPQSFYLAGEIGGFAVHLVRKAN